MKILHVIPAIAPRYGGPSTAVIQMSRALAAAGAEVHLASTDADGLERLPYPLGEWVTVEGVRTILFRRQFSEALNKLGAAGVVVALHGGAGPRRARPCAAVTRLPGRGGSVPGQCGPLHRPATGHPGPLVIGTEAVEEACAPRAERPEGAGRCGGGALHGIGRAAARGRRFRDETRLCGTAGSRRRGPERGAGAGFCPAPGTVRAGPVAPSSSQGAGCPHRRVRRRAFHRSQVAARDSRRW